MQTMLSGYQLSSAFVSDFDGIPNGAVPKQQSIESSFAAVAPYEKQSNPLVDPLFMYWLFLSTRFKMFAAALPKEFNVIEVRAFIFIYIIFNGLRGKLSYIVLLWADKTCFLS